MRLAGDCSECAVAIVAIQIAAPKIVGHVKIRKTAGAGFTPGTGEAVAIILRIQAGGVRAVDKNSIPLVMQKEIWRTIPRIEIRHRVVVLVQSQVVAIHAEIDIQASVAVVVGDRRMRECSFGRMRKLEGISLNRECAISLIEEQQWAAATYHQKILQTSVLKVGEERAGSVVQYTDAGLFGDILKRSVAAVAVEPIGQSRRLADVQVVVAIIVEVAGGHAVVAIHINAARAIEHCAPVVGAAEHLVFVGRQSRPGPAT